MSNFTPLMFQIAAMGLRVLSQLSMGLRVVNRDFQPLTANRGDTIRYPTGANLEASEVVPGDPPDTVADVDEKTIVLDTWRQVAFPVTAKQEKEILEMHDDYVPRFAVEEHIEDVDSFIQRYIRAAAGRCIAIPAGNGFSEDLVEFLDIDQYLTENKVPAAGRSMVVSPRIARQLYREDRFIEDRSADTASTGQMGELFGYNVIKTPSLKTVRASTIAAAGGLKVNGAAAAGATEINFDGGVAATYAKGTSNVPTKKYPRPDNPVVTIGDVIKFGTEYYPIRETAAGAAGTIKLSRPLAANVANDADITRVTFKPSYMLHRDAVKFISRLLAMGTQNPAQITMPLSHPETGQGMSYTVYGQFMQVIHSFHLLFGLNVNRENFCGMIIEETT